MKNKAVEKIIEIVQSLPPLPVSSEFINRVKEGKITRDENPYNHFCVYFAGYDHNNKKVFIGHHKKANIWLFNGGHIDKNEIPEDTLFIEIKEEWGQTNTYLNNNIKANFLTITHINNQERQKCTLHFDIWYFISLSESTFKPKQNLLETEFYTTGWKTITEARKLITDPNTLKAIDKLKENF